MIHGRVSWAASEQRTQFDAGRIQNVYGIAGLEFAAMNNALLQQPGGWDGAYIETGVGYVGGHGAAQMTDSLAVHDLFVRADPGLAAQTPASLLAQLNPLFEAASVDASKSFEALITALGKLLLGQDPEMVVNDRESLYSAVHAIREALEGHEYAVTFLLDKTPAAIAAIAGTDSPAGIATRYALKELIPFAIVGVDYGNLHNQDGALDLYDPETGEGELSEQWIRDRAAMLAGVLAAQTADSGEGKTLEGGKDNDRMSARIEWILARAASVDSNPIWVH